VAKLKYDHILIILCANAAIGEQVENAMAAPPLFILLCSAEHEKIQMAAMMAAVAAVSAT
jgi:hypothetical protein